MIFLRLSLFLAGLCLAAPAMAQELAFKAAPSESQLFFVNQYLGPDAKPYDVATLDLNRDGIEELVVRSQACAPGGACFYLILADADGRPAELGVIEAVRVTPGQRFSNGVLDLVAYQDPGNDYAHNIYTWDSTTSRYKISE
ncbi:MAG: hypothetical protein ACT4OY_03185 [Alphaproteobacteria bacterium]